MLRAENIGYSAGGRTILQHLSACFLPGEFNMILGPNGSGKSSFLKIFSGEIKDFTGDVFYGDQSIASLRPITLASMRAVMSQQPELSFPLTVEEVVMMGRYPHFTFSAGPADEAICGEVINKMQLQEFRDRNYLTLSGGEKQRVQFARLLAQVWKKPATGCRYLFLDEPLNNLDIKYQQEFLQVARSMLDANTVLIAVMHDINLAFQYADNIFFLKDGQLAANGKTPEVVTAAVIEKVFDVKALIIQHPESSSPLVVIDNSSTYS